MFKAVKRLMDLKQNYGYVRVIKEKLTFLSPRNNRPADKRQCKGLTVSLAAFIYRTVSPLCRVYTN